MATSIKNEQIVAGYAEMAARYLNEGWSPYLLTFMFQQIAGSPTRVAQQMEREVERVYSRFVTRVVRHPRSAFEIGRLPVWIGSPDFPVFKHAKQTLDEVIINDGCHLHAIDLQPPVSRLPVGVDEHFAQKQALYVRPGFPLLRVHAVPVTHDLENVVGYVAKALKRGLVTEEAVFVLPRSRSELPS